MIEDYFQKKTALFHNKAVLSKFGKTFKFAFYEKINNSKFKKKLT